MKFDLAQMFLGFAVGVSLMITISGIADVINEESPLKEIRKEAIERGFAEYVVNSDGLMSWQWKGSPP